MSDIKPVRIQRSRKHKQVSPNGLPIVYVGRPTKWGNPYKVVDIRPGVFSVRVDSHVNDPKIIDILTGYCHLEYTSKKAAKHDCINCFAIYVNTKIDEKKLDITELEGKNLSCWCEKDVCHADVLLELANK